MKYYPKMKDSGIEWIGKIPEEWKIIRIKYVLNSGKDGIKIGPFGSSLRLDLMVESGYKIYGQENVIKSNFELGHRFIDENKFHEMQGYEIHYGDIIVTMMGTTGLAKVVPSKIEKGIMDSHLVRIRVNNELCHNYFLEFLIDTSDYVKIQMKLASKGSIMEGLNSSILKSIQLALPQNVREQKQITEYLTKETAKIDSEISKNQKLIELLKEKRQSTINQAVTKGLDPTVTMKDSGIEWIGKMTKSWDVSKIKFTSYVKGRVGWQGLRSEEFTDSGAFLITGTDFKEGRINWDTCHHVENWRYEQDPYIQIQENDILITKDGTIGKVAFVDRVPDKTTLNSGIMIIRPLNKKFIPNYLYWTLQSNQFIDFIEMIKSGSTIQHLYQETFENFSFVLPKTLDEQKQIVEYLEFKTAQIDDMLYMVSCQIKKLEEYRQSLILSAVTGKIDVRQEIPA